MRKRKFRRIPKLDAKTLWLGYEIYLLIRGGKKRKAKKQKAKGALSLAVVGRFGFAAGVLFKFLKVAFGSGKPKLRFRHKLAEGEGLLITHKKSGS